MRFKQFDKVQLVETCTNRREYIVVDTEENGDVKLFPSDGGMQCVAHEDMLIPSTI